MYQYINADQQSLDRLCVQEKMMIELTLSDGREDGKIGRVCVGKEKKMYDEGPD
jgi:hypothetical protein